MTGHTLCPGFCSAKGNCYKPADPGPVWCPECTTEMRETAAEKIAEMRRALDDRCTS